jgi:hypothetical protein
VPDRDDPAAGADEVGAVGGIGDGRAGSAGIGVRAGKAVAEDVGALARAEGADRGTLAAGRVAMRGAGRSGGAMSATSSDSPRKPTRIAAPPYRITVFSERPRERRGE